ncbi:hypothetical protein [Myroides odoratimimus]|uniref:hypothetical protein n=1 Tax=Myroides odoratimimus TaxID=76832 RepID=UPI0025752535|nr:hypothetical protein [Myroides odoratimimus]MDM1057891.1 hypothetical protein [Myroides odoratimimus]
MESKIFQNIPERERVQYLKDNAVSSEQKTYMRALDKAEVIELQNKYAQKAIELNIADEILKSHRETFKATAKPLKSEMGKIMQGIRTSSEEITEEVFLLADMDEQMMGYYNSLGELIYSRPLLASERQFSITSSVMQKLG